MTVFHKRIGLVGKSGSGKSVAGSFLNIQHGYRHVKTGAICREIARMLFGNEDKKSTQLLDDTLTQIDNSIFLRASLEGVNLEGLIVIDSLRFKSDLDLARELGFFVVRIEADEPTRLSRLRSRGQAYDPKTDGIHRSEVELEVEVVDATICNDAATEVFHQRLMDAVAQHS